MKNWEWVGRKDESRMDQKEGIGDNEIQIGI